MTDLASDLQTSVAAIMRVMKIAEPAVVSAHGEYQMIPADLQSLRFIAEHPGSRATALSQHLGVAPTTATGIIDRLVKRGFLRRERPEGDRRSVALTLTAAGATAFSRIDAEERAMMELMLSALDPDERAGFVAQMRKIAAGVTRRGP